MTAQILDGKATAAAIKSELTARVAELKARGITPGLGTLLVGDDPGSRWYVNGKHKDCAEVGIASIQRELPATASQEDIESVVRELNANPDCTGYIVQLPLPKGIDTNRVLELMDPAKDADGLHPMSLGRLVLNEPGPLPCTPYGIVRLLRHHGIEINGAHVVLLGRGITVGRSMGLLLTRKSENATVTLCHTGTLDLPAQLRQADIIVAAHRRPAPGQAGGREARRGRPGRGRQPRRARQDRRRRAPGRRRGGLLDLPNPGGVGPMTRAQLLVNVVEAAERTSTSAG